VVVGKEGTAHERGPFRDVVGDDVSESLGFGCKGYGPSAEKWIGEG
jgi:hypothetical protein